MSRPHALVTRRLAGPVMAFLEEHLAVDAWEEDRPIPRETLLERIAGAAGVLPMLTDRIDAEALDAAGAGLRVVANYAVGYDNVDVAACAEREIVVTNTPDVLTDATADMAIGLLLDASRRISEGDRRMRGEEAWEWSPSFMLGREVTGATLGIVGFGRIGQAVARRAAGFRMRVLACTRAPRPEAAAALGAEERDLASLLAEADAVSLHVPLTRETRHLIGAPELEAMRATAVLVNTSRGPVVDEAALAAALRTGGIRAAGLDVYEREPEAHPDLLGLENVVLAPHLGSATVETREAMGMLAARNLVAVLGGEEPPSAVGAPGPR